MCANPSYLHSNSTLLGFESCVFVAKMRIAPMTMGDPGSRRMERRRSPRYSYQAPLEIEWGSARLKGRTRDISESGMFIEAEDVLWVGAGFRARLSTERPVYLECSVKRVEPGRGMGVSVALAEDQHQESYAQLLSKLAGDS